MARSPKTFPVLLKDGTKARAVCLTPRNNLTVLNWIPGAEFREQVSKGGQVSNQRLMLPVNGTKVIRAAYYDDWVVKTDKGFSIVKFDKVDKEFFFVDTDRTQEETDKAHKRWVKSLDK